MQKKSLQEKAVVLRSSFLSMNFIMRCGILLVCLTAMKLVAESLETNATPINSERDSQSSLNSSVQPNVPAPSNAAASSNTPAPLIVITPTLEKSSHAHLVYFVQLLELALQKTQASDGPYVVQQYPDLFTINRFMSELERDNGVINVMWTMADNNRNQRLLPIKISLLKGLNSYRIFLIRADDQEKFHQVKSLDQLRELVGGQGSHWPDSDIMRRNGLPLITSAHYELLFSMLANKRFDYFPRGLYEIWNEQQANADKHLKIEDSLMLHYPAPIYFYVNKKNVALADRIERGLKIAIEDGSFDKLFFNVPGFKRGYEELKNNNRIKFDLISEADLED